MRIVIDYRPALRRRTGVGEYIHQVAAALASMGRDEITVFSSSWKDRPMPDLSADLPNVRIVDRRIPVQALNLLWHRAQWPPIETVAGGSYDIAHSPHPLLLPARSAARVITVHDLHFLSHPERTSGEIRRDYPALVHAHAHAADRIVVSSNYAAGEVHRRLSVPRERIAVCPAGAPAWRTPPAFPGEGYLLFLGALEPRKNVRGLLAAYRRVAARLPSAPRLVLAGPAGSESDAVMAELGAAPLAGRTEHRGYVDADSREPLFKGAKLLVLPSFEEGFGLTVLEAMAAGVPVVASNRGSIPEVLGEAGLLINPDDTDALASAITRMLEDDALRSSCARRGLERAAQFTWAHTAHATRRAYEEAIDAHRH